MKILNLDDILPLLDNESVIDAVKKAFIAHAAGEITSPTPLHLGINKANGEYFADCHVKVAYSKSSDYFSIKTATGFYDNADKNLPVNNGMVMLLSSETGEPVAFLQDEGVLTSMRTAAAGALAASLAKLSPTQTLGIVGTGNQSELQAKWISEYLGIQSVMVYGRSRKKAVRLASKLAADISNVSVADTTKDLCSNCSIIVTTTPATKPVLMMEDIQPGTHIVAIGSDSPGKQELDSQILAHAQVIVTDDHQQCLDHGEFGVACRESVIKDDVDVPLGAMLSKTVDAGISGQDISVVDLTGLGVQDLAISSLVYERYLAKKN